MSECDGCKQSFSAKVMTATEGEENLCPPVLLGVV